MRTTRPGTLLAVGLGVLVVITVLLFTVPLHDGVEMVLQVLWVALVVVLSWSTSRLMRRRQREGVGRVKADGAGETDELRQLDRRTLTGQDKQPPHVR
ncbi:hypothetical protein [Isoptericola sp. NPDC057653]|uniref:hypothetical protein n=1 Tax=unclassified Isoptericola TaxID=2623355 RepID=UPI0036755408